MSEEIEKAIYRLKIHSSGAGLGNGTCVVNVEDVETVLNELEEYEKTLDIFDEREYRKKYLEEERAKRPNLLYPDADEIYERYFQQKAELEKKDTIINEMADILSSICTGIEIIREQFVKEYCEFYNSDKECCWKTDKECSDCIKEYFTKKCEGK